MSVIDEGAARSAVEPGLEAPLLPAGAPTASAGDSPLLPAAAETKRMLAIGGPMVLEEVLSYASTLISLGMVGRLGAFALSAFTLSHSITNITGIALLNGITGVVDTFGSQAHGSRAFPAVGLALQRAVLVSLAACVPLMLLYWQAGPALLALGQEPRLAAAAARYTLIYGPKIALHAVVLCLYRTLASQGAAGYVLAASTVFFAATAPINWLLIFRLGWGIDGSAAAAVACEGVYAASLAVLCAVHNRRQLAEERWWRGWSRHALRGDWGPFLKISAAATAMIVLDWWAYDILTLLAGLLPPVDVGMAATGIMYNIQTTGTVMQSSWHHWGSPLLSALGSATTWALADRWPPKWQVGTALGVLVSGLPALLLMLSRGRAAALLTSDEEVVEACSKLMLPLATLMLTNGATALLSGILRGSGRQKTGALVNGSANYGLGLPLELLFAFHLQAGVAGLWWGIAAAATVQAVVLAALVGRFDWRQEAARAARLVRHLSKDSFGPTSAQREREERQLLLEAHAAVSEPDGTGGLEAPPLL